MDYKYQRRQIFGKRLKVPKHVLNKVYNCTLSFNEYIEYQLDDKIPTSCIVKSDRKIVERFGIDKCKELDWKLINKRIYDNNISFRDILMSIDSQTEDINHALYELVKDQIKPSDYSLKMSEIYSDRLFEIPEIENYGTYDYSESRLRSLKRNFNDGKVSLKEIISNWELFKDKDLSFCLLNDENNKNNITDSSLKEFMNNYGTLVPLIVENNDIYAFINTISSLSSEEEKHNYLKQFTDDILNNTYRKYGDGRPPIKPTDEQYKEIFKYSSMEEYLKIFNEYSATPVIEELKSLPQDYVFNMSIPFSKLLNYDVLSFVGTYGLKNIVDFDNECGHFFTKNNCEMLKLMNDMYLHYSRNEHDPNKTIHTKKNIDENGNYIDRPYTKDEFYEAMKRMIIYGPSDWNYADKAPDYRDMTGEFRIRNAELFISEEAPEELQKMFYTKSITPQLLLEHPEYIQFLNGKDLSSCLKNREIQVEGSNALYGYENIYKFLGNKTDFNGVMNFITEYSDVLDVVFDRRISDHYLYEAKFSINDDIDQIQNRIHETLRKLIVEKGLTYPTHIPKDLIEKYPSMFLDKNAPKELQEAFYGRTITSAFIISNPAYRDYLNGVDLECLFKYMPVGIMPKNSSNDLSISGPLGHRTIYHQINFVNALKETFGESDALDVMLIYGKYVEQVYEANNLKNFLYNPDFTQDGFLDELDKTILQNIIDGNMKYDDSIPSHFKNNNPTLFLGANVPQEIKNKFYNRGFTIDEFKNDPKLLDMFGSTSITLGLMDTRYCSIGIYMSNKTFLYLVDKCLENTVLNNSAICSKIVGLNNPNLTIEELKQLILNYFKENDVDFSLIYLFDGSEDEYVQSIFENINNLLKVRPELDYNNPALCSKLLSPKMVNTYGYNIISILLEYNSGAASIVIREIENETSLMKDWINYVIKLPFYNDKILHHAVLMYDKTLNLIGELINSNVLLNEAQYKNLYEIIIQDNEYGVSNIDELTNYIKYRKEHLDNKVNSGDVETVKSGLLEILFNTDLYETKKIIGEFGLNSDLFLEILLEDNVIDVTEEATIVTINEILNVQNISDMERFKDIEKLGNIVNLTEIAVKIKRYIGKTFKESLFHSDGKKKEGIQYSTTKGLDDSDMLNIDGEPFTSSYTIDVVELEGIDFKLLIHKLHTYDPKFTNYAARIMKKPELWNKLEGASTLSTSMISDNHMSCVGHGGSGFVYYGFSNISDESLMLMGPSDIYVSHGGRLLEPSSNRDTKYMVPDALQAMSNGYNEVALGRKSSSSKEHGHRLQPTCIICFDGHINDDARRAAQYFKIPIYMINRTKYVEKNNDQKEKYISGNITTLTVEDCRRILYLKGLSLTEKYNLLLKLSDKALSEKIISLEQYIIILKEARRIMAYYSAHEDISNIQLSEIVNRISEASKSMEDQYETKKRQ